MSQFFRPYRAWRICGTITQGGADFVSLALGYHLPGFQPLDSDRPRGLQRE